MKGVCVCVCVCVCVFMCVCGFAWLKEAWIIQPVGRAAWGISNGPCTPCDGKHSNLIGRICFHTLTHRTRTWCCVTYEFFFEYKSGRKQWRDDVSVKYTFNNPTLAFCLCPGLSLPQLLRPPCWSVLVGHPSRGQFTPILWDKATSRTSLHLLLFLPLLTSLSSTPATQKRAQRGPI